MSEPIKPALTAEEWSPIPEIQWQVNGRNFWLRSSDEDHPGHYVLMLGAERYGWSATQVDNHQHGIAALALHGQSFGFTREDARKLAGIIEAYHETESVLEEMLNDQAMFNWFKSLHDRIESFLPPEK